MDHVAIREVGPRDGLQGEAPLAVEARVALVERLIAAGLTDIEAVAFVSPNAVPAMAGAAEVVAGVGDRGGVTVWGLVPNTRGAELAVAAGVDAITYTLSACPVYSMRNVRMTVDEALAVFGEVRDVAGPRPVDVVISCAFGSPYTGDAPTGRVPGLLEAVREVGADAVTLADTTGMATPARVRALLAATGTGVGLHLHDTRGTALVNAHQALCCGVRRFDTAIGGIGGSPFAQGAGGNLGTEDLVHLLDDEGIHTGVDLDAVVALSRELAATLGRALPSRIAVHGSRSAPGSGV